MVCQLSVWCGSAHDEFSSSFICFLPFAGSIKFSCHKAPVGGQQDFRLQQYLNCYLHHYSAAFALSNLSVRRFPLPCGYGFIPVIYSK